MADATIDINQEDTAALILPPEEWPDIEHLVTEDDTPLDNFASEKQQRLLTEPLYSSWDGPGEDRPFLAAANVGLFFSLHRPPLVPDTFLSLDVEVPENWWEKGRRAYFLWEFGKMPEVVIEVVSNRHGGETTRKLEEYARLGIFYYVIFDPLEQIQDEALVAYELSPNRTYRKISPALLEGVGLGLTLWSGVYEGKEDIWLRWQDSAGHLILTGAERAEQERQRADAAQERAERLAAQLRALGVDPDEES